MDAVAALGIADDLLVGGDPGLPRLQLFPEDVVDRRAAPVVHAVDFVVLEDRHVEGDVSFPGLVEDEYLLGAPGLLDLQLHAVHGLDEGVVDEKLQAVPQVGSRAGIGGLLPVTRRPGAGPARQNQQYQHPQNRFHGSLLARNPKAYMPSRRLAGSMIQSQSSARNSSLWAISAMRPITV